MRYIPQPSSSDKKTYRLTRTLVSENMYQANFSWIWEGELPEGKSLEDIDQYGSSPPSWVFEAPTILVAWYPMNGDSDHLFSDNNEVFNRHVRRRGYQEIEPSYQGSSLVNGLNAMIDEHLSGSYTKENGKLWRDDTDSPSATAQWIDHLCGTGPG